MANKKHTMVLENRIIITTGEDSFRVVNTLGESVRYDAEIPYNSVKTVLGDGDTLTIASVWQGKTRCLVNGLFSDYTLDGQEFNSLSELEEALSKKLFKNPEGGGGKGATVLKYEDGQITLDGTPLTKAEIEELMAEQGLVVLSADAYGLQGVVCLPYTSEDGKLNFVGTVQSGGVDATIMYAMDDEDAVEGPTIVANETLSNKAESIIETYAEDQIRMYPTIYAVLNFVYGQQYASVKVVSELPTDDETKGYFTDIYIKYEDGYYKAYKMVNGEWVVLNPKSTRKVFYNSESGTVSDTYANIKAALDNGIHVYVDDNRGQFTYSQYLGESITFTRTSEDKVETITVNSDGTAAYSSVEFSDFKGMTDDEARTVSEALNDLNNRIGDAKSDIDQLKGKVLDSPDIITLMWVGSKIVNEDYTDASCSEILGILSTTSITGRNIPYVTVVGHGSVPYALSLRSWMPGENGTITFGVFNQGTMNDVEWVWHASDNSITATSRPMASVWSGTQEQYDALATKENGTLYLIEEEE